jgi:peptide deformylase
VTIRKVLRAGHPSLRDSSDEIDDSTIGTDELTRLLHDMFETMQDYTGVGLAAPQVQENRRILVYEIHDVERYDSIEESVPPTVMINPQITERSEEVTVDWEGCLSYPDLRGKVPRSSWIRVRYLNRHGESNQRKIEGFEARVVQHEIDHLNGQLFVERMNNLDSLCFFEEYQRFHSENN